MALIEHVYPRTTQPQGDGAQLIDSAIIMLSAGSGPIDLVSGSRMSATATGVATGGNAFRFDGSALTACATRRSEAFLDCTFVGFFRVTTAVAWSSIMYDRGGVNGCAFGDDGLTFYYIWDGSEWSYSTGLTFALREDVAFAYSVRDTSVTIALNGKLHRRTGLSNTARALATDTQNGTSYWIGGDSFGGRTLKGDIYLAGICDGAWSDERLLSFSLNPWGEVFEPGRIPIPNSAAAGGLPDITSLTYVPGSITSSGFRPRMVVT